LEGGEGARFHHSSDACAAQTAQIQHFPCAAGGTWASKALEKLALTHQQGSGLGLAKVMAQWLGWPHKGQRQGSGEAGAGDMVKV